MRDDPYSTFAIAAASLLGACDAPDDISVTSEAVVAGEMCSNFEGANGRSP